MRRSWDLSRVSADGSALDPRTNATNALEAGLTGDGTTNDTAAFQAAVDAALLTSSNLWNGYHVLYFPPGSYRLQSFAITDRENLMLIGDGDSSLIRRLGFRGSNDLGTFTECSKLWIRNLAFDQNGAEFFNGIRLYGIQDLKITENHWYDSAPLGFGSRDFDRYAFVNGHNIPPSRDVYVAGNLIEDLQVELDDCQRALVEHNTSLRAPTTVGIGCFGISDDSVCIDFTMRYNKIYDAAGFAITFNKDTPANLRNIFRRINCYANEIRYSQFSPPAIYMGSGSTTAVQTTDLFEDINISGNTITYAPSCPDGGSEHSVISFLGASNITSYKWNRGRVSDNTIIGNGRIGGSYAIQIRRPQNLRVEGNNVSGTVDGIFIAHQIQNNVVKYNTVHASRTAYALIGTLGGDVGGNVLTDNLFLGAPTDPLLTDNLDGTDVAAEPTDAN